MNSNLSSKIEKRLDILIDKQFIDNSYNNKINKLNRSIYFSTSGILVGLSFLVISLSGNYSIDMNNFGLDFFLKSTPIFLSASVPLIGILNLYKNLKELKKEDKSYSVNYEKEYLKINDFNYHINNLENFYGVKFKEENIIEMKNLKNKSLKEEMIKKSIRNLKIK